MEVNIQPLNFTIKESLTEYINKKAASLARHNSILSALDVTLKVERPQTVVNKSATIKAIGIGGNAMVIANKVADTFEEAVDVCLDGIDKQLERKKAERRD